MRRLMWFTIGFGAVCGLCSYVSVFFGIPVAMLLLAATVIACVLPGKKWVYPLVLICSGCILGQVWFAVYSGSYLRTAAAADDSIRTIRIRATEYSQTTGYGTCIDGRMEMDGNTYFLRAYINSEEEIQPGDNLTGSFLLRFTAGEGCREKTYHRGNGIYFLAYAQEETMVIPGEKTWADYPALVSREISQLLDVFFPSDTAPFAKALLLGDTSELTYRQDTDLKLSGIRHIVAVSGLHVSILFALISTLTLKRRWLRILIGLPALFFFAAMTGFSPSVNRACLMCGLMLLSILLRRDYDGATALSFSCLVMLVANPLVITSAAFQLSVGCVAGIFLFQNRIQSWLLSRLGKSVGKGPVSRLKRWFAGSISVSISAMSFSLPLSALYFGTVSLVGVLANLLTLWIVSLIFCGILGVCLIGMVYNTGALFLARMISIPIRYVLLVAKILSSFPMAAIYTQSVYVIVWLLFLYGLLALFLVQKNRSVVITCCCAVVGLCVALTASWLEPMTDDVRLTVLDVGHGQSILLQWSGNTFLVDCGGDSDIQTADKVAQTLLSQGTARLDGLILTHMDADHTGGAAHLLSRIDAERVVVPEVRKGNGIPGDEIAPLESVSYSADGAVLTIFGPITDEGGNENSLCVLFESENCAILITGDRSGFGERMLMRYTNLPQVDVLIAGHHGSPESTGYELLEQVQPRHVILSAETANIQLLQRLREYGCQVWRTDRSGTIVYRR